VLFTFLPFHDTNIFARLLSLLDLASCKDYAWLSEFAKAQSPVPRTVLVKQCLASTHALVSALAQHVDRVIEVLPLSRLPMPV
jgi:hypothetical protein